MRPAESRGEVSGLALQPGVMGLCGPSHGALRKGSRFLPGDFWRRFMKCKGSWAKGNAIARLYALTLFEPPRLPVRDRNGSIGLSVFGGWAAEAYSRGSAPAVAMPHLTPAWATFRHDSEGK